VGRNGRVSLLISTKSGTSTPFQTLSNLLSISHESAEHFPEVHSRAREEILRRYPSEPRPANYGNWRDVKDATKLCLRFGPREALKPLFYALITHGEFDDPLPPPSDSLASPPTSTPPGSSPSHPSSTLPVSKLTDAQLEASIAHRCTTGIRSILDYFTPILFTPPPASHMGCTDKIAENWMNLVLQPALDNGGMYKPLETLEAMRNVEWERVGVCKGCVEEKRVEWEKEKEGVWVRLGEWVGLETWSEGSGLVAQ